MVVSVMMLNRKLISVVFILTGRKSFFFMTASVFYKIRIFPKNYQTFINPVLKMHNYESWTRLNIVNEFPILSNRFIRITRSPRIYGRLLHHEKIRSRGFLPYFVSSFEGASAKRIFLIDLYRKKFGSYFESIISACPEEVERMLVCVDAPVSGAHGDLSCKNVMIDEFNQFHIIDWEMADENGSYTVDAIRFIASSMKLNSSPPQDVLKIISSKNFIRLKKFVPSNIFFPVYILERAHVEMFVRGDNLTKVKSALKLRFYAAADEIFETDKLKNGTIFHLDEIVQRLVRRF